MNTRNATPAKARVRPAKSPSELTTQGKTSKIDRLVELLTRPGGATIAEMCDTTGWQPHSVRGALAGALRKKGFAVSSEVTDGIRRYRIGDAG